MEQFTKFIIAEKSETVDAERSVVGWGSKPLPDRDGELIEASAWDLDNFRKTPVLCLSHDLAKPPIGKILWIKADPNGLKFKAQFAGTERGKEVYQLYKEGMMNAFSVGFRPKKDGFVDNPLDEKYKGMNLKRVFKAVELFEVSCVTVPALPSAVAEYVKSGKIQDAELKGELEEIMEKAVVEESKVEEVKAEPIAGVIVEEKKEELPKEEIAEKKEEKVGIVELDAKALQPLLDMLEVMKSKMTEMEGKLKKEEESKEEVIEEDTKTLDFITKQPSVYDVLSALGNTFQNKETALPTIAGDAVSPVTERPYVYVVDLYPTTYPDGFAVFRLSTYGATPSKTFRQGYVYDAITKKATVIDEAIAVEEAWVEKKYTPERLAEIDEEMEEKGIEDEDDLETKKGRVLSAANRKLMEDCVGQMTDCMDQMTECSDSIQGLLDTTADTSEEGKSVDEEDNIEIDDLEDKGIDTHIEDDHIEGDEIQLDEEVKTVSEDKDDEDLDIDEKELSDIIARTVGSATKELNSMVKGKAVEEANRLMGKATL